MCGSFTAKNPDVYVSSYHRGDVQSGEIFDYWVSSPVEVLSNINRPAAPGVHKLRNLLRSGFVVQRVFDKDVMGNRSLPF